MITKLTLKKGTWRLLLSLGLGLGIAVSSYAQQSTRSSSTRSSTRSGSSSSRSGSSSSRSSSSGYVPNGQIGEAMISSDPETRRIIVITDEETSQHIAQVITNLDKPKPQVLIKVVFLEVTYNKASDIGLDGSVSRKVDLGSSTSSLINASNLFSTAALGNNSLPVGSGGFYQILGNDWQVTLRAIAEAGKTEVLSRPSIMARNNQQAVIMVGQRIPIITGSQTIPLTGGINNTISYENVGIILRVTPFISSDGLVEMIVAPEISSLANQGVSISTGTTGSYNAPVINSRSAETVVVTPDGTTVVIGGLMANTKSENIRKIPIVGDIPLLGKLFQRKTIDNTKTELMIFLTPHIVNLPSQVATLTAAERAKSVLTRKAFTDQEVDRFIDALPVKTDNATDATKVPKKPGTSTTKKSK